MRLAKMLVLGVIVLLIGACGPMESLNPLFHNNDLVFDPSLIGTWIPKGEQVSKLEFLKVEGNAYEVVQSEINRVTQVEEEAKFETHLVKLGGYFFLDVVPEKREATPGSYKLCLVRLEYYNGFEPHLFRAADGLYLDLEPDEDGADGASYELRVISSHWFFKVSIEGDSLRLAHLDDEWVQKMIENGTIDIAHKLVGEDRKDVVLTASTEDLQQFVLAHVEDQEAFPKQEEWSRVK